MIDLFLILLLAGIALAIVFYIRREKKRGTKCIGCPYAKQCAEKGRTACSCRGEKNSETSETK